VFLLLLFIFLSNDVKVFAKGNPPAISSENAILMDGASGKILYSKNPPLIDGSKAGIKEKEEVTVKDLLYGLLFVSGNDCANALAEHMAGSVENFSKMMNKRAKELGLANTHFVNPSGRYQHKQRSTVKDLALIMRELVKRPEYLQMAADNRVYYICPKNNARIRYPIPNENKMVRKGSQF
jgi:D-alanyl-D-alanine carboxypeptidase